MATTDPSPLVGVIMGSKSDWDTMRHTDQVLTDFEVPHECLVCSAHRTPVETAEWAQQAEARGLKVIIAAAGGAAHLAGVVAAYTTVPVLGVPIESQALRDGLAAVDGADAGRHPRGHAGDWQGRRDQR